SARATAWRPMARSSRARPSPRTSRSSPGNRRRCARPRGMGARRWLARAARPAHSSTPGPSSPIARRSSRASPRAPAPSWGACARARGPSAPGPTPPQREPGRLVRWLAVVATLLCLLVVLLYGLGRADWLDGLLAGLTLAMAILPNEFPAVLAIFLALGARR